MNRRTFLKCGACSLVALTGPPRFLVRTAAATAARGKVLVAVFQRGAVDGLSMVVPHGDPAYAAARQTIALGPPTITSARWMASSTTYSGYKIA